LPEFNNLKKKEREKLLSAKINQLSKEDGKDKIKGKDGDLEDDFDEFWQAMGRETANIHNPSGDVPKDLKKRNQDNTNWLGEAALKMKEKVLQDWQEVRQN
jgi:hypothetical protein